jgi:four helix bundle protein
MLYHNILVWKKAHELTLKIYLITKNYPRDELYGIVSQIRRASSSVPANIVEGNARRSSKEFAQYLIQARGSLSETQYFLELSRDLNYITESDYLNIIDMSTEVAKMLNSLITKIKSLSY